MTANAFDFALALHNPQVRARLAQRGYVSGSTVRVATDPLHTHEGGHAADFLVWPDSSIPGGWDGCPVPAAP